MQRIERQKVRSVKKNLKIIFFEKPLKMDLETLIFD